MRVQNAAVIGHPIGHTMSPFIHQRLFALEGIPDEEVENIKTVGALVEYIEGHTNA